MSLLEEIQALQFHDRAAAEGLLLGFVRDTFPALDVQTVELRPLAVSLNSFNGFLTTGGGARLFFKTHTEPDGVLAEYYNATQLAEAGYPVLQPLYTSQTADRQLLIYPVVDDPSVFDVAWALETGARDDLAALTAAQNAADDDLLTTYRRSLDWQSAEEAARAPVHQLFYHRMTGGRMARFYGAGDGSDVPIRLPGRSATMRDARTARWVINGQHYDETIDQIAARAVVLLDPAQAGPSVAGHGDAHNGNVFYRGEGAPLLYFDPAFAGRHDPFLDLTKPLFHNVFAMWMYHPAVKRDGLRISLRVEGETWHVEHDYTLPPVREMFLSSKIDRVFVPTLRDLRVRGWLRDDWRARLKAALFCCPYLTMNLADDAKFPPEICLLGLTMVVEMGAESAQARSRIDHALDHAEAALRG
jgi:hypothetical protein